MLRVLAAILLAPAIGVLGLLWMTQSAPRADFVVASDQLRFIDPHRVSYMDEIQAAGALFDGLTRLNPHTQQPEPAIAARWDVSADGRTYTFHLRETRWSNGEPLIAEHFRWAWLRVLDPANEAQYAALLFCIEGAEQAYRAALSSAASGAPLQAAAAGDVGVTALDAATLRVKLTAPRSYFLELLALPVFAPVYPPLLERFAYRDGRVLRPTRHLWTRPEHLVCNGAFTLTDWRFKESLLLRRNPLHWDPHATNLESIELYLSGDASARLLAYQSARVDLVRALDTDLAVRLGQERASGARSDFFVGERFATFFLRVNCQRPPLDDAHVRRALSLAIDRDALCERVLGLGEAPAYSYVPRGALSLMPGTTPDGRTIFYQPPGGLGSASSAAQRIEQARAELQRSRFADPQPRRPIELAFAPEPPQHRRICEALQEMWQRNLGLRVELRALESKVLGQRIRELDYDIARSNWFGDYLDPAAFVEMFTSVSGQNRTGWSNAAYDRLVAAAAVETDAAQRYAALAAAEATLVEQELPIIPLFFMTGNYLLRPGFTDLPDGMRGTLQLHRARRAVEEGRSMP